MYKEPQIQIKDTTGTTGSKNHYFSLSSLKLKQVKAIQAFLSKRQSNSGFSETAVMFQSQVNMSVISITMEWDIIFPNNGNEGEM